MPINLRELSDLMTLAAMHRISNDFAAERVTVEKSLEKIRDLGLEPTKDEAGTEWDKFCRALQILADGVTGPQDRRQGTLEKFAYVFDDEPADANLLRQVGDNSMTAS
jgi:hypothetical protein